MISIWFQLPILLWVSLAAFYKCYISVVKRSLYFKILAVSFFIMFVFPVNTRSDNRHGPF